MRRQMNRGRHGFLARAAAFAMISCVTIGSVCVPIFAEEKQNDLKCDNNATESYMQDGNIREQGSEGPNDNLEEKASDQHMETDISEETDKDTGEEIQKGIDETDTGKDVQGTEQEKNNTNNDNDIDNETSKDGKEEEKMSQSDEKDTVSGNDIDKKEENSETQEDLETINIVVPTAYTLALNPYRLPIKTEEDWITTEQVISGMYGIVNKSSTDQIVTVSLDIADNNEGELVFVDSAEEAENAGMDVYAIYLAAVPASEEEILIDNEPVDKDVTGESLKNIRMIEAEEQAVTLHEGMNQIAFKLSGAVYSTESGLEGLAPDGMGVTAYSFIGVMNPDASWEKLPGGIKLSVVYTYQTADGDEKIVEGTGAMIRMDK